MKTAAIREKLHDYINIADDEKVKAIYTLVEEQITPAYDWAGDKEFVAELDERLDKLNSGEDPGRKWSEIEKSIAQLKTERNRV